MSYSANPIKAGLSQMETSSNDHEQFNYDDRLMGDGDGYTGDQLEALAKSGIEQVSTEQFNWIEAFYEYLLPALGDEVNEADKKVRDLKKRECIRSDLIRYQKEIGTPPSDLTPKQIEEKDENGKKFTRAQTSQEVEFDWCRDRLIVVKRKALCKDAFNDYVQQYQKQMEEKRALGRGRKLENWMRNTKLLLDPENPSNLEDILDVVEGEEDLLEDLHRPKEMTDEAWSWTKWEQMKKNRVQEQDEDKTRQHQLEAGAKVAAPDGDFSVLDKTIVSLKEDIPDSVREIHRMMCIVMFQWWDSTQSTQDMVNFRICSERLDRLPDAAMYRVAPTEISHYMERLKKTLLECKTGASQEDLVTLAGITITLTNKLRKSGLDLNMVIGRDALRQIFRHLFNEDIEILRPLCDQIQLAYLRPRKEHIVIYSAIDTILLALLGPNQATIRSEGLMICFEQMKRLNERIGDHNKVYGVQYTDHQIPTNDLEAAIRLYKSGQLNDIKYQLSRLVSKMALLGVPNSDTLRSHPALVGCEVDQKAILHEILGISTCGDRQYTSMVQNVTALVRSPHSSEYAGVPMETVAWGKIRNSYFYINQYGPQNATIYRRERHQSDDWAREHGNLGGPSEFEVTSKQNRPGEWRETDWSPLKYGKRHVLGLYGVAYAVPRDAEDPLKPLDPDWYSSSSSRRNDVYVLVGWDFELTQKDPVLKWETRSRVLDLWKEDADPSIYGAAAESQARFEAWKRGELKSQDTSLHPLAQSATDKLRYTSPGSKVSGSKVSDSQSTSSELEYSDEDEATAREEGASSKWRIRPSIELANRKKPASERVRSRNRSQFGRFDGNDESTAESSSEPTPGSRRKHRPTKSPFSDGRETPQYRGSKRKINNPGTLSKKASQPSPQEIREEYDRLVFRFGRDWMKRMDRG